MFQFIPMQAEISMALMIVIILIADLVMKAPILHTDNVLSSSHAHEDLCGCDKFHLVHPDTDWMAGLRHAEQIGIGTMQYELIHV